MIINMKLLTVIGARPQFVKASALSRAIIKANNQHSTPIIREVIVHTGQHYDQNMSQVFFDELGIPKPDYFFESGGKHQASMTAHIMEQLEGVLMLEQPDALLVYGDTNSTLAGALTAVKLHIPVLHIEAGLRSFDKKMPEEVNRVLTDYCADMLFTPSQEGANNLKNEGLDKSSISVVGDIMYDVLLHYKDQALLQSTILQELKLKPSTYVMATCHRQSNTDDHQALKEVFEGLVKVSATQPVVCPLHPRTKKALVEAKLFEKYSSKIQFCEPLRYLDTLALMAQASCLITDSGGMQKEAYFLKVPCIILRDTTEWIELVNQGLSQLVGADSNKIKAAFDQIGSQKLNWKEGIYGDGNTAEKIIEQVSEKFLAQKVGV